ncbi:MAG: dihydrolipoamide acetyltransferase family protein [Dehalococcoidia bacterium]
MATVTMPQLGESVTEGTIIQWLKQPGDRVRIDEPLCEIETEKVTAELPSEFEGTMGEILVPQGETVAVGAPLCEIVEAGAPAKDAREPVAAGSWQGGPMAIPEDRPLPAGERAPSPAGPSLKANRPAPARPASQANGHNPEDRSRFVSPAVGRLAAEHGIDLATVEGTGIGGRVTRKDIEARIAAGPAQPSVAAGPAAAPAPIRTARPATGGGEGYEVVTLSATRRTIAEHLRRSNLEAPQAWTMVEADITGLVRLREREKERFEQEEGVALTLLPYFATAVCETLREFPMLNARWEGDELRRYHAFDLGIAVAAESGLVVPVVHGAGDLSVAGLARRIAELAAKAHARTLRVDDIEGGTFTVNNTGAFGSIASKPIVNAPQVAIVTMERAVKRAVVRDDDSIAVRWMMNVCLSFDHRALDGLEAGGFLAALKGRLESHG